MLKRLLLLVAICCFLSSGASAQEDMVDLHHMAFDKASVNGAYYTPDATSYYNPATLSELEDYQMKSCVGAGVGKTQFSNGAIDYHYYGAYGKLANNLFAGAYQYNTSASVGFTQGLLVGSTVKTNIPATEMLVEYKANKNFSVGLGLITGENGNLNLSNSGIALASSDLTTKYNYRIGLSYKTDDRKIKLGLVHNRIKNNFSQTLQPALTGIPILLKVNDSVRAEHTTLGFQYNPKLSTSFFYSHRFSRYYRKGYDRSWKLNYPYYGAKQFVNKNLQLHVAFQDKYPEYGINYFGNTGWSGSVLYRKGEPISGLGENDTYFFSISKSF